MAPTTVSTQVAYTGLVQVMTGILKANYHAAGKHGRNLKEDHEYFRSKGVSIEKLSEEELAILDPSSNQQLFGPATVKRMKNELIDNISKIPFPWAKITEDMVATYRCGITATDTNEIPWKSVVAKVMVTICRDIFGHRVEELCQKMKVFLDELVDVAVEIFPTITDNPKLIDIGMYFEDNSDIVLYLKNKISAAIEESVDSVRVLTNDLVSAVLCSNASWSELSNPTGLNEPKDLGVTGESLMWVRTSSSFLWSSFLIQLKMAIDAMFNTFFIDKIFESLSL